jgi:DNA-directed RNA polymerase specialized sigma24 family protein
MNYNHGLAEKKFKEHWVETANEYRKAGMTEEQITAIYEFDREVFNSDRRHNENTVRLFDNENNSTLAVYDNYSSDNRYGWLDEIDNMESYSKIMAMPKIWREAFTMYIFDGYTQQEISSKLLKPQQTISRWIVKIAEIIFEVGKTV